MLVQAAIGMIVNLKVTIPLHHPGAKPSNYLVGSFHSVVWSIGHGAAALAIHATFGLALVLFAIGIAIYAFRLRSGVIAAWSVLAAALILGAGFNGASFLDFNESTSSLIMALLAFGAVGCYSVVLFLS